MPGKGFGTQEWWKCDWVDLEDLEQIYECQF